MKHNVVKFIKKELLSFTGLNQEDLDLYLSRKQFPHFKNEWDFWAPNNNENMRFFYMASRGYLFGNATHVLPEAIYDDISVNDKVLDFGGGSGNYSFPLAQKGCNVSYFDINILQKDFVSYVSKRNNLDIRVLDYDEKFLPVIECKLDVVMVLDVLEHIPNYDIYVKNFSESLNKDGRVYIFAPFGASPSDPTHLNDNLGFEDVMEKNNLFFDRKIAVNNGAFGKVYVKR